MNGIERLKRSSLDVPDQFDYHRPTKREKRWNIELLVDVVEAAACVVDTAPVSPATERLKRAIDKVNREAV